VREQLLKPVPWPMRYLVFLMIRRDLNNAMYGQGLGRHTEDELMDFAEQDFDALSKFLGDRKFFFSDDQPSTADVVAFGELFNIIAAKIPGRLQRVANKFDNLKAYVDRMTKLFDAAAKYRTGVVTL